MVVLLLLELKLFKTLMHHINLKKKVAVAHQFSFHRLVRKVLLLQLGVDLYLTIIRSFRVRQPLHKDHLLLPQPKETRAEVISNKTKFNST